MRVKVADEPPVTLTDENHRSQSLVAFVLPARAPDKNRIYYRRHIGMVFVGNRVAPSSHMPAAKSE